MYPGCPASSWSWCRRRISSLKTIESGMYILPFQNITPSFSSQPSSLASTAPLTSSLIYFFASLTSFHTPSSFTSITLNFSGLSTIFSSLSPFPLSWSGHLDNFFHCVSWLVDQFKIVVLEFGQPVSLSVIKLLGLVKIPKVFMIWPYFELICS